MIQWILFVNLPLASILILPFNFVNLTSSEHLHLLPNPRLNRNSAPSCKTVQLSARPYCSKGRFSPLVRSLLLLHCVIRVRCSSHRRTSINYRRTANNCISIGASRLQRRGRAVVLSVVSFTAKETHRYCKRDSQTLQKRPTDTAKETYRHYSALSRSLLAFKNPSS
jgi:hypothetical protein